MSESRVAIRHEDQDGQGMNSIDIEAYAMGRVSGANESFKPPGTKGILKETQFHQESSWK